MGKVINLNKFRKRKAKAEASKRAETNRLARAMSCESASSSRRSTARASSADRTTVRTPRLDRARRPLSL
jgi:hypothetical protein